VLARHGNMTSPKLARNIDPAEKTYHQLQLVQYITTSIRNNQAQNPACCS